MALLVDPGRRPRAAEALAEAQASGQGGIKQLAKMDGRTIRAGTIRLCLGLPTARLSRPGKPISFFRPVPNPWNVSHHWKFLHLRFLWEHRQHLADRSLTRW